MRANFLQVLCSIWRLFLRPALCAPGSAQTRSRRKGEAHETGWGTASDGHALGVAPRWSVHEGPCLWCRRHEGPPHAPVSLTRYGPAKAVFPIPAVLQEGHVHTMDPRYSASVDGGCAAERAGTRCAAVGRGDQPGGLSRNFIPRNCRNDIPAAVGLGIDRSPAARPEMSASSGRAGPVHSLTFWREQPDNWCATSPQNSRTCRSPTAPLVNDIPSTFNPVNKTKRCVMGGT